MANNLRAMVEMARNRGAAVVLLGVPQFGLLFRPPDLAAASLRPIAPNQTIRAAVKLGFHFGRHGPYSLVDSAT